MTPKSLLRNPKAVSSLDDCASGTFQRVLPDTSASSAKQVRRILLCTGKIYYDLDAYRTESKRNDVDIIRLEQLYPLRRDLLESALSSYSKDVPVVWVQEEPENMGALTFMRVNFGQNIFGHPFSSTSREASASPATGSHRQHKNEQQQLVEKSFETVI
jgi:2-oxoglutarate dehydrogenase E1 component